MSYRRYVYLLSVRANDVSPAFPAVRHTFQERGVYGTLERAKAATGVVAWESDGGTHIGDTDDARYTWCVVRTEVR